MKKICLLLVLSGLLVSGCEKTGSKFIRTRYFVENYVGGDYALEPHRYSEPGSCDWTKVGGFFITPNDPVYYQSPELAGARYSDEFLRIAARNGDTSFDGMKMECERSELFYADNFTAVRVVSDRDWDAEHPAGTPLNDKMNIRYTSCAEFIGSGYIWSLLGESMRTKRLCDLASDDLRVVRFDTRSIILYFVEVPEHSEEKHTLTVTLTDAAGRVREISSEPFLPGVDPELSKGEAPYSGGR